MASSIISVGVQLPAEEVHQSDFLSRTSLLDWDIVLFRPDISFFVNYADEEYLGKPCLDDRKSFQLKEHSEHWRREIRGAIESGKNVFVFLSDLQEIYVSTGEKEYSGTGRNRKTTRIVSNYNNYTAIPTEIQVTATNGQAMKLVAGHRAWLAGYWQSFGDRSRYKVVFEEHAGTTTITTKNGSRIVGAIITAKKGGGRLVLLPDLDFENENLFTEHMPARPTKVGREFARSLIASLVGLDKALRSTSEVTPEPEWASKSTYTTDRETHLRGALLTAEEKVERAQREKEEIESQLTEAGALRGLLYESGKRLEGSVIEALQTLGFSAHPFQEADSEFDVVFTSEEGRLIGEAEGKDNKAINVEKLRQLSMNIHEDLQREDTIVAAKGILFGNGFRLADPGGRDPQFTEKCVSAAQSTGIGLVETSALFLRAKYVEDSSDDQFAKACREVLVSSTGIIELPPVPGEASASGEEKEAAAAPAENS